MALSFPRFALFLVAGAALTVACRPHGSREASVDDPTPRHAGMASNVALDEPFAAQSLNLDVRSGDVTIQGGADGRLLVECGGRYAQRCSELSAALHGSNLEIKGGPRNHFALRISVPAQLHLRVRMPAGELSISGIHGDKDVRLNAGELNIAVSDPDEYGPVKASVMAGEISAAPFGRSADGIFRSLDHHGIGRYRLSARLMAGEISIR